MTNNDAHFLCTRGEGDDFVSVIKISSKPGFGDLLLFSSRLLKTILNFGRWRYGETKRFILILSWKPGCNWNPTRSSYLSRMASITCGVFFWSLTDEIRPCRSRISNKNDLSAHRRPVCFPSSVNSWERQNSVKIVFTRLKYYKNRQFKWMNEWMNEWILNKASIVHIQKEVKSKSRIIKETIPSPYANQ